MPASPTATYPAALDSPQAPSQFDSLATDGVEHDYVHDWAIDAIKKIEAKLGITSSPDVTSVDYVLKNHQHQGTDRSAQFARLPIKMVASQTLAPVEVQNNLGTTLSAITAAGEFLDIGASAGTLAIRSYVTGDATDRFQVQADGKILWGAGTVAPDVMLARTSGSTLTLTGNLSITNPLPIASGGTGSATQNFVDLSSTQAAIAGAKTFSSRLTAAGLTSSGTIVGSASAAMLDLTAAGGTAAGTGSQLGDKVQFYATSYGLGVQSASLVAYMPASSGLAIRVGAVSGQKSSGTDAVRLNADGSIVATAGITATSLALSGTPLAIASGGTGSITQNFVDLTTAQTVAGLKTLSAGLSVTGSPSGYGAPVGEVTGGQLALTTTVTGAPRMYFDHRGTTNTGDWVWRNGTGAASSRMTLDGTGLLSPVSLSTGNITATGTNQYFGPYATSVGVGIRARMLFGSDVVFMSESDATTPDVGMIIRPKGAGTAQMQNSGSQVVVEAGVSAGARTLGFFATTPALKQTITGSRGTATATVLGSLLTALALHGLITNSTTA